MEISEGGGAILEVWGPDEAFHLDEACMAIEDISEENPGHPELAKAIGPLDRVHLDKVRAGVVARALQNFGDARVVPLLIKIAKRREICREAYEALGELGDERAVEPMLERNENLRDGSAPARHCLIQLAKKNPENISVLRMVRKTSELLGRHDIAEYAADDLMEMLELCDTELKVDIFKGNLDAGLDDAVMKGLKPSEKSEELILELRRIDEKKTKLEEDKDGSVGPYR